MTASLRILEFFFLFRVYWTLNLSIQCMAELPVDRGPLPTIVAYLYFGWGGKPFVTDDQVLFQSFHHFLPLPLALPLHILCFQVNHLKLEYTSRISTTYYIAVFLYSVQKTFNNDYHSNCQTICTHCQQHNRSPLPIISSTKFWKNTSSEKLLSHKTEFSVSFSSPYGSTAVHNSIIFINDDLCFLVLSIVQDWLFTSIWW